MSEYPEYISLNQAHKISGLSLSQIGKNIETKLYGDIKQTQNGKRKSWKIPTEKFQEVHKDLDLQWDNLKPSKKTSKDIPLDDPRNIQGISIKNKELEIELKAALETIERLEADKSDYKQRLDTANEERQREQVIRANIESQRNQMQTMLALMNDRAGKLGFGDGLKLLVGIKPKLALPAQEFDSETQTDDFIDAEAEEVSSAKGSQK